MLNLEQTGLRIIVPYSPDNFCLTCFQRLKHFLFHRLLKSRRDIADADKGWDESEVMTQADSKVDYGKSVCEMFGFMIQE